MVKCKKAILVLAPFLILVFHACATISTGNVPTNLTAAYLYNTATMKPTIYSELSNDLSNKKTFSIFSFSLISKEPSMNSIMETQMLFQLRNWLERIGYKFISLNEKPDFIVTIVAIAKYYEQEVPPSTSVFPVFVPGSRINTNTSSFGSFNFNTIGQYASYGWGTWSAQGNKTTYLPSRVALINYTKPGYRMGHYYPSVLVSALDMTKLAVVWTGSNTGISDYPDVRVSGQFVLGNLMSKFPYLSSKPAFGTLAGTLGSALGIDYAIFTEDGNSYFPTMVKLRPNGPAQKAGLKEYDTIIEVNGISTENKSFYECLKIIEPYLFKELRFKIKRANQVFECALKISPKDYFGQNK